MDEQLRNGFKENARNVNKNQSSIQIVTSGLQ